MSFDQKSLDDLAAKYTEAWNSKVPENVAAYPLNVSGWEEWELNDDMKITSSLGWFDADSYQRQVDGAGS